MTAVEIIKVRGTSEESWEAAAEEAIERANQSAEGISGIEVEDWTASVDDSEAS